MQNEPLEILHQLIARYGSALPPIPEREQVWEALAKTRNSDLLKEIDRFLKHNQHKLHDTFKGEIARIIYDDDAFSFD